METAVVNEAVKVAAPVATGTLDYKKVAMITGGILVIGVSAYATKKLIDKRKAKKAEAAMAVATVSDIQVEPAN